jgi:hypothetical protein
MLKPPMPMVKTLLVAGALIAAAMTTAVVMADNGPPWSNNEAAEGSIAQRSVADHEDRPTWHGPCAAWAANEQGRTHGNASHAPPFAALQEQANGTTVTEFCEDVQPPGGNPDGNAPAGLQSQANERRGPPEDLPRGPPEQHPGQANSTSNANVTASDSNDNATSGPSGNNTAGNPNANRGNNGNPGNNGQGAGKQDENEAES